MKKKILFLIHDLGGGGAEKVLVNLVNHMNSDIFDIHVVALFGRGINEKNLSQNIHYSHVWKRPFPKNSLILRQISASLLHKICIKDTYDIEISYLEDICAKIISGCPNRQTKRICWVHTDLHSSAVASRGFRNYNEAANAFKAFDKIVCVSNTVKESFGNIYPEVKNICVKYNTIDSNLIRIKKNEDITEQEFNLNEIKLIAIGKITKNKGFDRLAKIITQLQNEGFPVHIFILGIGPDQTQIEEYLRWNHMESYYTFLGYQNNPYKYLAKCDLYVCASWAEGFSTAATEALIVGTPVCTVEVSGMKEMLGENDEWGIVTENTDEALYQGIKKMISDPAVLTYYQEKACERGKHFSTENTVKAVEKMIKELGSVS